MSDGVPKSNIESLTIKKVPYFSSLRIYTSSTPSPPPRSDVVAVTEPIWEVITKQNDAVAATKVVALRSCMMEVFFVFDVDVASWCLVWLYLIL